MLSLPPALAALGAWPQFVCWFAQPKPENPAKLNKFPCDWRTGAVVGINDRAAWTTPEVALAAHAQFDRGYGSGAGFVFTADDPFFFADVDGALLPDGQWAPIVHDVLARFPGAAVEVSHSGQGVHVFGRAAPIPHGKRNVQHGLELYTEGRFCALTGLQATGDAGTDHTAAFARYVADYFPPQAVGAPGAEWTTEPVAEWSGPADDDELIRRMLAAADKPSAAQAFGAVGGATLRDLWEADADALARAFPPQSPGKAYDGSSADMALANHLAWWTGKNCERMERLMRRSGLAREKWDAHRSYLVDTVSRAAAFIRNVLTDRAPPPPAEITEAQQVAAVAAGRALHDPTREWMMPFDQLDHFRDCFFVALPKTPVIFDLRANAIVGKATFDVTRGGHMFVMDPAGQKTTDSAWDAFTKNRVNKPLVVSDMVFRPASPPGALVRLGDRVAVNTYVPYEPRTEPGDASPFLDLLRKMLPHDGDRAYLLAWMASFAQNPGVKFQWWPVIQGVKGNGKTLLLEVLSYLVGELYTHMPDAQAMAKSMQFNGWIDRKLFIGIEEIKATDRREMLEAMKTLVTNRRMGMEKKGLDQFTGDNAANGVITTNHKDGLPMEPDERRYAIFYCAQQEVADLARDGMDGQYLPDLYDWVRGTGAWAVKGADHGKAVVAHYLRTMPIPAELDPARGLHRAPRTTATAEAIEVSRGRVEQEILEAVEEGRPGFAGGWVSSRYLNDMIDRLRAGVPQAKRRALMQSLGYDWHPVLHNGRTNDVVMPDNGKPKLYVRAGHLALQLTTPKAVADAYADAQAKALAPGGAAVAAFKA